MDERYSSDTNTITRNQTALVRPRMWTCLFLNDDFTPMAFVIEVLMQIFNQQKTAAEAITLRIHTKGKATVGVFPKDIAHLKAYQTISLAAGQGYPLQVVPEQLV
jgi:ATP-dependent Clp protease adaptor protein ClpS